MQDEKRQAVTAWVKKAEDDLRSARAVIDAMPPLVESALFHCQQAVEKAMKAFLTAHDTPFRKTHNLDELAGQCEKIDDTLKTIFDSARDLTVFAWEFRYPGEGEPPPEKVAHEAIEQAQNVLKTVRSRFTGL